MSNELIEPAKVESVQDIIVEKIKKHFVELVPEDRWKEMVQGEIDKFCQSSRIDQGYNRKPKIIPSPLEDIIQAELKERFKEKIKEEFNKEEYQQMWNDKGVKTPAKVIVEITKEVLPAVMQQMFESMIQETVDRIKRDVTY